MKALQTGFGMAVVTAALLLGCGGKDHDKHGEKGHDEHGEKGHDEHGEKGHDEHGEKGHDEHGEKGHDEHGEKGHDEKGEKGHDEHEEGVVVLSKEAAVRARIKTAVAEKRALTSEIATTGEVGFNEQKIAHISPLVSGRVHKVRGRLGAKVKAGEAVVVLKSVALGKAKAAYLRAKARHDLAKSRYEREKALVERKISSEQEMLSARARYLEGKADLQGARQTLRLFGISGRWIKKIAYSSSGMALYWVRSPIGGKITEKHVTVGELVTPARNLFTVADLRSVWIWIDIYERDIARVHLQDIAYVRADSFPNRVFEGKLTYVRDQVDVDSRTVRARIAVPNLDGALRPGMFVRVRLVDPHGKNKSTKPQMGVAIPKKALLRAGKDTHVFVKEGENRYERRKVRLGRRSAEWVEVLDGVKAGESVVVAGVFILKSEASKESMGGGHSH